MPALINGAGAGVREFGKATRQVLQELTQLNPHEKERGLVYEALTPENRIAEFHVLYRFRLAAFFRATILFIAQGFGVGRIPVAPGTFGSLVGLVWFAALLATRRFELYVLGSFCSIGLSVWLCGVAEKILKQKDPPSVVLDEIIALPFCFLPWVIQAWWPQHSLPSLETFFSGRGLRMSVVILILFRIFDILKPWPIHQSQRLPGGWGITIDDVLAAFYVALLSLFLLV